MKNKYIKSFACFILCLLMVLQSGFPARAEKTNTITISSTEEFLDFTRNCTLDSYSVNLEVLLECDLDLSGTGFEGIPIFSGHFDGNYHTVRGINLSHDGSVQGFFRYLTEAAHVEDLDLEGLILPQGSRAMVGALAGSNAGHIENCTFNGTLSGSEQVGGLVGINTVTGVLERCSVKGNVYGNHFVGGLAGENNGVIRNCVNSAQVNTTPQQNTIEISDITMETLTSSESPNTVTDIGGMAGVNSGVIRSCRNYGDVGYSQIGYNIGGISGTQTGYLFKCKNLGSISGRKEVGGIAGQMEPVTKLEYTMDTLQILEEQLNTMSSLTNRASINARNQASSITSQITTLKDQTAASSDAVRHLISEIESASSQIPDWDTSEFENIDWENFDPENSDLEMPELDMDGVLAAESNLSTQLDNMNGTLNSIASSAQDAGASISKDMDAISKQVNAMSKTLNSAEDHLGGSVKDVSDNDTEQDTTGKVDSCQNAGAVLADMSAGGITGSIAFENDLDPEADIEVLGNTSLNFNSELRSVIVNCRNEGSVTAKKQNAGGIVGWQSMGLVKGCLNTGDLLSESADYVGGIAGNGTGFIRSNSAKCQIEGSSYVGGIAGLGSTLTDNRSMVLMASGSEKLGAILGLWQEPFPGEFSTSTLEHAAEDTSHESEALLNNYYPIWDQDPGAIDGISYAGCAEGLPLKEFLALEALPEEFGAVTVTFAFENGNKETLSLKVGDSLKKDQIPPLPQVEGSTAAWIDLHAEPIYFDTTFSADSTALRNTIGSDLSGQNGLPVLLLQGSFSPDCEVLLTESRNSPPLSDDKVPVAIWSFTVSGDATLTGARCLIPEDWDGADLQIMILRSDGSWEMADCTADGSYLIFELTGEDTAFALIHTKTLPWSFMAIAGGVALLLLILLLLAIMRKKQTSHS